MRILITLCFLSPVLLCAGEKMHIEGSSHVALLAEAFAEDYMKSHSDVEITVHISGSHAGAESLRRGGCHIAMMGRWMNPAEWTAAASNSVMPTAHLVGLDALAIIVHPSNVVDALSIPQIRRIYAGDIRNWKELGGADMPITVLSHDASSDTSDTFSRIVMTHTVGGVLRTESMHAAAEDVGDGVTIRHRVQQETGAVAYVSFPLVSARVKPLSVNGILCTRDTVQRGVYPIISPLYMFTDRYPVVGSHLHRFLSMPFSSRGKSLTNNIGFSPLTGYGVE